MVFLAFITFYVPMCFVVGVAAAAISASAWPFVVPILLSFDVFGDFTSIFDPVLLSICLDLSNAMILCFLYQRQGKVAWHPAAVRIHKPARSPLPRPSLTRQGAPLTWLACFLAQVLGLIAATPAVGLAFLAQRVLENYTDIIKRLSGWGLFVFAMIFLIKGFKLRAAAKAAPVTARAPAETPAADPGDVSIEVTGSPKGGGGFTVGSQEERAKGEVEGLTGGAASPAVSASYLSPQCNRLRCACAGLRSLVAAC
jgi:hypothetical protein